MVKEKTGLKWLGFLAILFFLSGIQNSCKISYSFTGANISPDVRTYAVSYFENRASLIYPELSQLFTEGLKEKLRRQTSLNEEETGDLEFSGYISGYSVQPMAIQGNDLAAQNRLTITVSVSYANNKEHSEDFSNRSFSAYADFDSNQSLNDIESSLVPEIIDMIFEDIYNVTIANW